MPFRSATTLVCTAAMSAMLLPASLAGAAVGVQQGAYAPAELLVRFSGRTARSKGLAAAQDMQARVKQRFQQLGVEHWVLPEGTDTEAAIQRLQATGLFEWVEPNYRRFPARLPNDGRYGGQWALDKMQLPAAWESTTGSASVIVGIVDDAFEIDHPDLAGNIALPGFSVIPGGDVTPDPQNQCSGLFSTDQSHGTQVAGVIGAVGNNSEGMAGVAWDVGIMPLKLGCGYNVDAELLAFDHAIANGAHIINVSYAGPMFSQAEVDGLTALHEAGILVVASAGNDHGDNDAVPMYPASVDLPNVIAVAATAADDSLVHWSHHGQFNVDLAAPGQNILTTTLGHTYKLSNGTSFSAPLVTGVAALLKALNPQAAVADLKGALLGSADPIAQGDRLASGGRVNAARAMALMKEAQAGNPSPVLVVHAVTVEDGAGGNGRLDPGETANLRIVLENVWGLANGVTASLASSHPGVSINTGEITYGDMAGHVSASDRVSRLFEVKMPRDLGYVRIPFTLRLRANGGEYQINRQFVLELAALYDGQALRDAIQRDAYDEFHRYHFQVPSGTRKVVIELDYDLSASRDVGLMVARDRLPQLLFNGGGSRGYEYPSGQSVVDGVYGVERFETNAGPGDAGAVLHALVFNTPGSDSTSYTRNVPYRIRACALNEVEMTNNIAPEVDVGEDIVVAPGQPVTLAGSARDADGEVANLWWVQQGGAHVDMNDPSGSTVSFTAPASPGELVFRLNATDDDCMMGMATVRVLVQLGETTPLQNLYDIVEGQSVSFRLPSAGTAVAWRSSNVPFDLGVQFNANSGEFFWPNAGPPGSYQMVFMPLDGSGKSYEVAILIRDRSQEAPATGGGCTLNPQAPFDPSQPVMLAGAMLYLLLRRRRLPSPTM